MRSQAEVLVIGGGIIGLTIAFELAGEGIDVALLDSGDIGKQASWAGAGILPPAPIGPDLVPIEALHALSILCHEQLAEALREEVGLDNGFRRTGGIEVGAGAQSSEWTSRGSPTEHLEPARIWALEPNLSRSFQSASLLPTMTQVRNPWHLRAMEAACVGRGVRLFPGAQVRRLNLGQGSISAYCERAAYCADKIVIASGAWSEALLNELGVCLGVEPVRGQIVLLNPGKKVLNHILLFGSQYLVPREDGRILIGSTEEHAGFEATPSVHGVRSLLDLACNLAPCLANAPVERAWAGLRPCTPDRLPYIGILPGAERVIVATGHFRSGITLSTGTAKVVADLIQRRQPRVPLEAFSLLRSVSKERLPET